jgi:hypothetical protein
MVWAISHPPIPGGPSMEPVYRKEINAFILDCETLLSPILLSPPLTVDEQKIIQFYTRQLESRYGEDERS